MAEPKAVCVFSSSSSAVPEKYFEVARQLGRELSRRGYPLVFGGTDVGLMGALAREVRLSGGQVIGVIPEAIRDLGIVFEEADRMVVTSDVRERKAIMEEFSDAFVALPGGFGTLDELAEALTLRQLGVHAKPVVLINSDGFYQPLGEMIDRFISERFAKPDHRELCRLVPDPVAALDYIDAFVARDLSRKWWHQDG